MRQTPKSLAGWISSVVASAPEHVSLIYVEWNDGRVGVRSVLSFMAFGYSIRSFDPEDPASIGALGDWIWEFPGSCNLSPKQWNDDTLRTSLAELFCNEPTLTARLISRGGQMIFGRHEGRVDVFPRFATRRPPNAYYELSVPDNSNSVEVQDDRLDNDPELLNRVIHYQKIEYPLSENATFHLQPRGKTLDALFAPRWFICSDRLREMIQIATEHCQVFAIRLYRSKRPIDSNLIPGYYVVHFYESIECLHPDDVLPPPFEEFFLPTFDPQNGYRILKDRVGERDVFRIAYEHQRLVVSQRFRDQCDAVGITGVEWLRRECVNSQSRN